MRGEIALALLVVLSTPAEKAASSPKDTVRAMLDAIAERGAGAKKAVSFIDTAGVSRFALADEWGKRTESERTAFVTLFERVLAEQAFPKAADFFEDVEVSFESERVTGGRAHVMTSVVSEGRGRIRIEYLLGERAGGWRVEDVVLDGVSLRTNLRAQFQKIIRDESFAALARKMEAKLPASKDEAR